MYPEKESVINMTPFFPIFLFKFGHISKSKLRWQNWSNSNNEKEIEPLFIHIQGSVAK